MKRLVSTLVALAVTTGVSVHSTRAGELMAQDASQCPAEDPSLEAALHDLREYMLKPGAKLDFAAITASPALQTVRRAEETRRSNDWAFLCKYKRQNDEARAQAAPDVVLLGDSITENWLQADPSLFSPSVVNRGISGQTSSQMLVRFYADVIGLEPKVVHIMAGTNDVAGNTGPIGDDDFKNNIRAMVELAKSHKISVVIASIPPARAFAWRPDLAPAKRIVGLNVWLKQYAEEQGAVYVDYYSALSDGAGGLDGALGNDGVHPNRDGYARMKPLAQQALKNSAR